VEDSKPIRAFIAIELPAKVKQLLTGLQAGLKATATGRVTWTRPEMMHLTVRFLGSIEEHQAPLVAAAIENAIKGMKVFELTTDRLGAFPSPRRPKTVWIGIRESCQLWSLSDRINAALKALGINEEKRAFRPHLTICRVRERSSVAERGSVKGLKKEIETNKDSLQVIFKVNEITLFKSELGGKGPVYTALRRIPLEG